MTSEFRKETLGKHRGEGTTPNNMLERSSDHRGRAVIAMDCALSGAEWASCPAAQQDR